MDISTRRSLTNRSSIQRKSIVEGSALQNQWLVIFPYELEFTTSFDSSTVFYLEKNYQLIGDLRKQFPSCAGPTKYRFTELNHLISFRLFSLNNLTYKWTMYRLHESGQEEFIEEFELDLKSHIAGQVITPTPISTTGSIIMSQDRSVITGWVIKDLQGSFQSSGVTLKYMLYVFDDLKEIQEKVRDFIAMNQQQNVRKEAAKSQPGENTSGANMQISSHLNSQNRRSNQKIEPNIMNTPQNTEQVPIPSEEPPAPQPVPDEVKQSEETPTPEPEPEIKEMVKSPSILKLESKPAEVKEQEPANQPMQELDAVLEQPERISIYLPEDTPEQENPAQQQQDTPADGEPSLPLTSLTPLETVKSYAANLDLKKVIIALLLVIIGMLAVVVFQGKRGEEKESRFSSKKRKKPKRK